MTPTEDNIRAAKVAVAAATRASRQADKQTALTAKLTDAHSAARDAHINAKQAHSEARAAATARDAPKNPKRVEAARTAAAASVERRREIHSAVASNLPHELQATWAKEGHKFMQQEAPRIRGEKDRINAASKLSEAFAEQYGAAGETGRGYEGDRYHRRAEIEANHAESWADEQERKYYAAAARYHRSEHVHDDEVPF